LAQSPRLRQGRQRDEHFTFRIHDLVINRDTASEPDTYSEELWIIDETYDGSGGASGSDFATSGSGTLEIWTNETYSISSTGAFTYNGDLVGSLSPDGSLFVVFNTDWIDDDIWMSIGIK